MAHPASRLASAAPSLAHPGAGRSALLPRNPGRATEVLYKRHGATVLRYAWHLLGRREDAEDATQATFLAVHAALAQGTAVLEPRAWVLRIARNECMERLRQMARRPVLGVVEEADPPAPGGVERAAESRAQMQTVQATLADLPEPEREAFVLREWLGLETSEVALALGVTAGNVEWLTARARRSLVLAVGGLEPAVGCAGTRAALEAGSLDRGAKVHLLRCPVCRGVRRSLRPPDAVASSRAPAAAVADRLADTVPGFAAGGGGILAALTAKAAAAPVLTKAAAVVAAVVLTGGVVDTAIRSTEPSVRGGAAGGGRGGAAVAVASPPAAVSNVLAPGTSVSSLRHDDRSSRGGPGRRADSEDSGRRHDDHGSASRGGESGDDKGGGDGKGSAIDDGRGSPGGSGDGADSRSGKDAPAAVAPTTAAAAQGDGGPGPSGSGGGSDDAGSGSGAQGGDDGSGGSG
jgi:RNA polymerase sigma-70 factor, ECF subfamily